MSKSNKLLFMISIETEPKPPITINPKKHKKYKHRIPPPNNQPTYPTIGLIKLLPNNSSALGLFS